MIAGTRMGEEYAGVAVTQTSYTILVSPAVAHRLGGGCFAGGNRGADLFQLSVGLSSSPALVTMGGQGDSHSVGNTVSKASMDEVHFPLLGLDVSEQRIGLAIAEGPAAPPHPLFTYSRIARTRDLAQCAEWVRRFAIGTVVVGLPVNMDGTLGARAQWMLGFVRDLRKQVPVPVVLQDERLSTVEALEMLRECGAGPQELAERVDAVAAALIIQRFLAERDGVQVDE